jgi:hypothetical protein
VPQLVGEDRCNSEQFREVLHAGMLRCSTVQCSVYLRYCAALCLSFFLFLSISYCLSLSLSLSLSLYLLLTNLSQIGYVSVLPLSSLPLCFSFFLHLLFIHFSLLFRHTIALKVNISLYTFTVKYSYFKFLKFPRQNLTVTTINLFPLDIFTANPPVPPRYRLPPDLGSNSGIPEGH